MGKDDPRIAIQRRVHELFRQKLASGEPVRKDEVKAIILAPLPDGTYRITESFRNFSDFRTFRGLVTQVKQEEGPPAAPTTRSFSTITF